MMQIYILYVVLFLKLILNRAKHPKLDNASSCFTNKYAHTPTFRTVDWPPFKKLKTGYVMYLMYLRFVPPSFKYSVVVSNIFCFTPFFGEDEPILTSICFKWVGSTTNQNMNSFATAIPMISSMRLQSSGLRYRLGTFFSVRPKSGSRICVFETFRVNNKPRGDTNWAKNGSTSTRMDRNMWL